MCSRHPAGDDTPTFGIADCIDDTSPWSGKPVRAGSWSASAIPDELETAIRRFEDARAAEGHRS